jgi:hypothetical protein
VPGGPMRATAGGGTRWRNNQHPFAGRIEQATGRTAQNE